MGTLDPSDPNRRIRGKVSGLVYSLQPNGIINVRSAGVQTAPSTKDEQKGQRRMKLGHAYVHGILSDPNLKSIYASEAQSRKMRTCDLVMADFLTDPVIVSVDSAKYRGRTEDWLLIMTGDDFKVVRVGVILRNAAGQQLEQGFAIPADGSAARVWLYTAQTDVAPGQVLTIQVNATDRAGHSTQLTIAHSI
jgi:hypothetical protein